MNISQRIGCQVLLHHTDIMTHTDTYWHILTHTFPGVIASSTVCFKSIGWHVFYWCLHVNYNYAHLTSCLQCPFFITDKSFTSFSTDVETTTYWVLFLRISLGAQWIAVHQMWVWFYLPQGGGVMDQVQEHCWVTEHCIVAWKWLVK